MSEDSPLSSMGVSGKNKLDRAGNERKILGMMRKQDVIAGSGTVLLQPSCLWLVSRCCNRPANPADALLTWISVGAAGFSTETSIVRNVAGGQTADDQAILFYPAIVKKCNSGLFYFFYVGAVHHPLVIAEGEIGRSDSNASRQERQDVFLHFQRRAIIFWVTAVKEVAGDADEGRTARVQARYDWRGIRIMEVGKQRQIWRSGDMVDCLFRRGSPPAVELTVKPGT